MHGNPQRIATVTGVGDINIYYIFDDDAKEAHLPKEEFSWWFDRELPTKVASASVCNCGGATTYGTDNKLYHSHWCAIQGE
jgi:hypothetical protein